MRIGGNGIICLSALFFYYALEYSLLGYKGIAANISGQEAKACLDNPDQVVRDAVDIQNFYAQLQKKYRYGRSFSY